MISLDINHKDWLEKDGFYYFRNPLDPGKLTQPLFTTVNFSPLMNNMYQGSTISFEVSAEAVQAGKNGENAMKAAGWP